MSESASDVSSNNSESDMADSDDTKSDASSPSRKKDAVLKDIELITDIADEMDKIKANVDALYAFNKVEEMTARDTIASPQESLHLSATAKPTIDKSTSTGDLLKLKPIIPTKDQIIKELQDTAQHAPVADSANTPRTKQHATQIDPAPHSSFYLAKQCIAIQPCASTAELQPEQLGSSDAPITPDDLHVSKPGTVFPTCSSKDMDQLKSDRNAQLGQSRGMSAYENDIESSSSGISTSSRFRASTSSEKVHSAPILPTATSLEDEDQQELDAIYAVLFE
uniref:AlNc14C10G1268 protein n=1 Tax=Albugo laibachii Nc14 TaxID=890382 RepID=F0W2M1_9STRA|nr:AlNc14C10G1268 [Albugo laibachii Nc14]|eukprot:CCA15307.1 AlNc14C10G1268 [Albugo laibachii Nc14]